MSTEPSLSDPRYLSLSSTYKVREKGLNIMRLWLWELMATAPILQRDRRRSWG